MASTLVAAWHRLGGLKPVLSLDNFDADLIGRRIGLTAKSLTHMPFPLLYTELPTPPHPRDM